MKTKSEIITTNGLIKSIESSIKGEELKPFKYVFLRNTLKFKNILTEQQEIIKQRNEDFEKIEGEHEEQTNKRFNVFLDEDETYQGFLKEETDVDYYTLSLSKLESDVDFNLNVAEILIEIGILVE